MRRKLKKNLLTLIIAIIFSFLLMEILLRIFLLPYYGIPPYTFIADEKLDYIPNPNFEGYIYNQEHLDYKIKININSDGFRDREFKIKKESNTLRIITLGDSETFPDTLKIEEQYGKVLENSLNKKTETLNFGVSGYGTKQEFEFLKRKGMKYNPDLVIYLFVTNDLVENIKHRYTIIKGSRVNYDWKNKKAIATLQVFIYRHSYIAREIYRLSKRPNGKEPAKIDEEKLSEEVWQSMEATLKEMELYFENNEIYFLVIINPFDKENIEEVYLTENKIIENKLIKLLKELNIDYINPSEEYNKKGGKEIFRWKKDSHLNDKGHELLAEIISKEIINNLS